MRENLSASQSLNARLFPWWIRIVFVVAGLIPVFAGIGLGYLAARQIQTDYALAFIPLGGAAGGWLGRPLNKRLLAWSIHRLGSWQLRNDRDVTIAFDEAGLRITTFGVDGRVEWQAIDQIFNNRGTMHLVTGLNCYYLPARCFASEADRKATFDYALTRLTPAARERSSG